MFTIVFSLFILFTAVQCFYALYFFRRAPALPSCRALPEAERQPVTILICAKNEATNLKKNLPAILSQRYCNALGKPLFEVLVVNDDSTDNTEEVLKDLELRYDNLWDVNSKGATDRLLKGKKHALSIGVAHAANEWLLLTDADCTPASDQWLGYMVAPLAGGKEIVAGYSGYRKAAGLLNTFIRWETLHTFVQYSSYILVGKPYMAVGRNMACTKNIFLKAQQHQTWNAIPSGDDDLLVAIGGTKDNVALVADKLAFTWTDAKKTWQEWIKQKQRHLSTGKYYKTSSKFLLAIYGLSHTGLWLSFFTLICSGFRQEVIVIMALRCAIYWLCWLFTNNKLQNKTSAIFYPFFDIAWMVYNFAFLPYITWKNKELWK